MSLRKEAASGIRWNTIATVSENVLSIARLAVVARFIDKADFGLFAIVNLVLGFTLMFSDMGMWAALMHKQNITENQYNSVYWFNWFINIAIFAVICVIAPVASIFYKEPQLTHLIILMGISVLIAPFGKIFSAIKNKNLDFEFITKVRLLKAVLSFLLVILFAMLGYGIYSLIWPTLIGGAVVALIYSIEGRKYVKVRFHYNFNEIRDFFKIGIYDTGAQIMDYLSYKIDVLLIGKFFGMEGLGLYNLAKEFALKAMKLLNPIVTSVATPMLAKVQDDAELIKRSYLKILNILTALNFPIILGIFAFSDSLVDLGLGANYHGVSIFLKILSLWGLFAVVGNAAGPLVIAKGRTDLSFKWTIIRFLCVPPTIFISSYFTINAVAYSQVILQVFFFYIYWRVLILPTSGITFKGYVRAIKDAFICSITALVPSMLFVYFFEGSVMVELLLGGSLFVGIYVLSISLLNRNLVNLVLSVIKK